MTPLPRYPADFPVFCIGGSAGAVKGFLALAEALPADFPAPIFFVLHRKNPGLRRSHHLLQDLLLSRSKLRVVTPVAGELVRSGRIYLPEPNRHLVVDDNHLWLPAEPADTPWRPSIDVAFQSIAREFGARAVAILLSGLLDDGVEGLREVTREGGITGVQQPEDAEAPDLPLNGILHDHPSYVMPVADLAAVFCELARHPYSSRSTRA
mgnify:FL=1